MFGAACLTAAANSGWDGSKDFLDPMCGSGSTIFAADVLGRDGFGCDISKEAKNVWDKYNINPYTALGYEK